MTRRTLAAALAAAAALAILAAGPGQAGKTTTTTTTTSTTTTTTTTTLAEEDREPTVELAPGWPLVSDVEATYRIARADAGRSAERAADADRAVAAARAALDAAVEARAAALDELKAATQAELAAADALAGPLPEPWVWADVEHQAELTRQTWIVLDGRRRTCAEWASPDGSAHGRPPPSTWPAGCRHLIQPYRVMLLVWDHHWLDG